MAARVCLALVALVCSAEGQSIGSAVCASSPPSCASQEVAAPESSSPLASTGCGTSHGLLASGVDDSTPCASNNAFGLGLGGSTIGAGIPGVFHYGLGGSNGGASSRRYPFGVESPFM